MAIETIHDYETRAQLAEALAIGVGAVLAGGIATNGHATLAVSGGSTPKLFFDYLSNVDIEWSKVTVLKAG
jgi:6-phosphogluconolactonase